MEITDELKEVYKEEYIQVTMRVLEADKPYAVMNFEDYIETSENLKLQGVFL
tara:strand:+ start:676 stop:831 length:156 start_codon:yes stop_codon:yes gene_type:complete